MYRGARAKRERLGQEHPTKVKITQAAASLLDTRDLDEITVDDVLAIAGVTKGAMYHHFEDYAEVLESALIVRFSAGVDWSIELLEAAFESTERDDEYLAKMRAVVRATHAPERAPIRLARARTLALAEHHPRLRRSLAAEQQRLTDTLTELLRDAQAKGLVTDAVDPHAGAVFIQAFTLGRIVDDFSERPVDYELWLQMIDHAIERAFGMPASRTPLAP